MKDETVTGLLVLCVGSIWIAVVRWTSYCTTWIVCCELHWQWYDVSKWRLWRWWFLLHGREYVFNSGKNLFSVLLPAVISAVNLIFWFHWWTLQKLIFKCIKFYNKPLENCVINFNVPDVHIVKFCHFCLFGKLAWIDENADANQVILEMATWVTLYYLDEVQPRPSNFTWLRTAQS